MPQGAPPPLPQPPNHAIELRQVVKAYDSAAGTFTALRGIDMQVNAGEFVAVIGKSGSGKSTLINMITAIDRPTSGEVVIGETRVHELSEGQAAQWRGREMGVVFQFFQLLPTLSVLQNVMLPMDFTGRRPRRERRQYALDLLDRVGMGAQAHKLPSAISGGQQQRVAIARALANDPPVVVADEPTGNLDSRTADSVYALFEELAREGKTIVMVTHDNDLARRVDRVIVVVDGQVVNQYVASALASLDLEQLSQAAARLSRLTYPAGSVIIRQGEEADRFYVVTRGQVDVLVEHPAGQAIPVARLGPGQFFGEIGLLQQARRMATVRASSDGPVDVMALDAESFRRMVGESPTTREQLTRILRERLGDVSAIH